MSAPILTDSRLAEGRRVATFPVKDAQVDDEVIELLAKQLAALRSGLPNASPASTVAEVVTDHTSGATVGAGASAYTIENIGTTSCSAASVTLAPGQKLTFVAPPGGKLTGVAHVASATAILRVTVIPSI
jgi:hypothetical protein